MENVDSFGDFSIVGDKFSESGGPAYAVAIHLTYLKSDGDMSIYHFVSDQNASAVNVAGKFREALEKLVREVRRKGSPIAVTDGVKQFIDLYDRQHFPGLGKVKQISMQHHMELVAEFNSRR